MNWSIKKILDDIIENAYKDESEQRRKFFKWFDIDLSVKPNNTYLGQYFPNGRRININSLNTNDTQIIITCIHELSHHIDQCKHGDTGHQAPFYEEYQRLLYTAMNMGLFSPDDFVKRETRDFNKVKKMLDAWVYEPIEYKNNLIKIKANVPFELKDTVKQRGYKWNGIEKVWEIEVPEDKESEEQAFLKMIGCVDIKSSDASKFTMSAIGYIKAGNGSFEVKDTLKQLGFFYSNKAWYKKINAQEYEQEFAKLGDLRTTVEFKLVNKIG